MLQAMLVARVLEPASKLATPRSACARRDGHLLAGPRAGRGPSAAWTISAGHWTGVHEAQPQSKRRLARQHLLAPGKEFHIYRHPMGRWYGRLPSPPKAERVVSEGS